MQIKPSAERTNLPLIAAFSVWLLAICALPYSSAIYFTLTAIALACFAAHIALNIRLRRA